MAGRRNKCRPKMMPTWALARQVPKAVSMAQRLGRDPVEKRSFVTSLPHFGVGCGASKKSLIRDGGGADKHHANNPCRKDDCPQPKAKTPCQKPPCPIPKANCPLNDPCVHCPFTPPPCPQQVHRCCPKPPCTPNPKEFKSVCCDKQRGDGNKNCDTCKKKPECCPCDPCESKSKKKKQDCCPADLQQKHMCSNPPPKRPLKRCERPEACNDPCCPRKPCCPDPCDKCKDPCEEPCDKCERPVLPDLCTELGIICGKDRDCKRKQPEHCPSGCTRKDRHLKKKKKPVPHPCCFDLDPDWPPKRPNCDAGCLSPDPCNPCQQACRAKKPFWDGL